MTLQRIRARVADRYGLTVEEMRQAVLRREEYDRLERVGKFSPMVTVHELRGGKACPGC